MVRTAWRELKFHPARYVATLVAIAISVGFMAAASIMTATESGAIGQQVAAPYSRADLVVSPSKAPDGVTNGQITQAIGSAPGVAQTEPIVSCTIILESHGKAEMASATAWPAVPFQWTTLRDGAWPQGAQIALNPRLADTLGVGVGDTVTSFGTTLTVSGITSELPSRLGGNPAIVDSAWLTGQYGDPYLLQTSWVVALDPGTTADQAQTAIASALTGLDVAADIVTGHEYVKTAAAEMTGGIDTFKYLLWVFAGIAMVVGLITIANTFTILLTGRRRQIGLMRTIGASGAQMRHSIWLEAGVLGLVGGIAGVALACALAALLGLYTGSIRYGLVVPWRDAAVAVGLGLVITVIACVAPARRATRVTPLEALQPTTADPRAGRVSAVRWVVCGLLFAGGLAVCLLSLTAGASSLLMAVGGAMAVALGVLFGARLFVPTLLRGAGHLVRRAGPAASAAAKNVVRDPARASATATALMLAVGLIITLQVGAASMRATVTDKIESAYPIDLSVVANPNETGQQVLPPSVVDQLNRIPGVGRAVPVQCRQLDDANLPGQLVCSYTPEVAGLTPGLPSSVPDDQIMVPENSFSLASGDQISVSGLTLTATASNAASYAYFFVSPATYDRLSGESWSPAAVFLTVPDTSMTVSVMQAVQQAVGGDVPIAQIDGNIVEKYTIDQVLNILVGAVTALLAVAVVIALVGVGNTLTLSVIERAHENAILRALGFQRRQIRIMLLVEALLLTLVGAVVGVVAGIFFGWLGARSVIGQVGSQGVDMKVHFALDWVQTLILLGVMVLAAGLASILPGRRGALASPVEALAEV